MDCHACRLDLSARLDGEEPVHPDPLVDDHLRACAACRRHAGSLAALAERLPAALGDDPPVSRSAVLLGAMAEARLAHHRRLDGVRWALLVVAVTQLAMAVPGLFATGGSGMAAHLSRHLGAWDLALAVGFLVVALQPVRVHGLLPMAAALALGMVAAVGFDLAGGTSMPMGEAVHVLELAGLVLLWVMSRLVRRPPGAERPIWSLS